MNKSIAIRFLESKRFELDEGEWPHALKKKVGNFDVEIRLALETDIKLDNPNRPAWGWSTEVIHRFDVGYTIYYTICYGGLTAYSFSRAINTIIKTLEEEDNG